jgi:hypothetical protein
MKALVLTRRTRLPASIRLCLNASTIPFSIAELSTDRSIEPATKMQGHINDADPSIIIIDGSYSPNDSQIWTELSKLDTKQLRQRILTGKKLPESLELLRLAHAVKEENCSIVVFIDQPSTILRDELRQLGALWVWPSLDKPSGTEASFYKIITGVHRFASGLRDLINVGVDEFKNFRNAAKK